MSEYNLPEKDDAPWLNLSLEEVQELRKNKQELTEYGKEKIRKLMNKEPTLDEMLEEAAKREEANAIVAKVSEEDYHKVMDAAARQELARNENTKIFKMKLIDRYNQFYNDECSGLSHGTPISMEHLQAITLECAIKAFARKYNLKDSIPVEDLLYLAKELMKQGERAVEKVSAEHRRVGDDTL